MKTDPNCFPCFLEQALKAAQAATNNEEQINQILDDIKNHIETISLECTPVENGMYIYEKVKEITGNDDPYKELKFKNTEKGLELLPVLKKKVEQSDDPIVSAIKISIAGNAIDYGINHGFDIDHEIEHVFDSKFAINDYEIFKEAIQKTDKILFIGDNAGESVFDKLLIEELNKKTIFIVREKPIINDVTYEDAVHAGIDTVAEIVSSGSTAPGTIIDNCTKEFQDLFYNAKLIISKGQGNFETLEEESKPIVFMLKAKCKVVADYLKVNLGDNILLAKNI
ncbi:DUF89 domain-containing protein [Candidatus Margulisiibacteriota bacterium]